MIQRIIVAERLAKMLRQPQRVFYLFFIPNLKELVQRGALIVVNVFAVPGLLCLGGC